MKQNQIRNKLFSEYPDVMDIEQMCQLLGVSTKTGYKLLKEEKITSLKVGRSYRIAKVHVLKYLNVGRKIDAQI